MDINRIITSVSGFLECIDELNLSYTVSDRSNAPTRCKFLYRGHSRTDYVLLPAIFRKANDTTYDLYLTYALEKEILQSFIAEACAYIKKDPSTDFMKWCEYAQHYGVPTRFLDWTENPLVALYFACKDHKPTYEEHNIEADEKDGCVWMLHLDNYRKLANQTKNNIFSDALKKNCTIAEAIEKIYSNGRMPEIIYKNPIVYKPYYVDARMSAQSSLFMVWGRESIPLDTMFLDPIRKLRSNRSGQERISSISQDNEVSFRFQIYKASKQKILRELDHCGINEKTLFPGVDGIGRYIEMKYRFDSEEAMDCI